MPTGRPDYWYGTALYFEDSPADGEVTRGPTSNWAFDHNANVDAHHPDPRAAVDVGLGEVVVAAGDRRYELWSAAGGTYDATIIRKSGVNGELQFVQNGTGAIAFRPGEAEEIELPNAGGVTGIWDDTPTDGEQTKGVTSDWGFDHVNAAAAHHARYTDAEAVTAMGAKGDANPLHHDIYSPNYQTTMLTGIWVAGDNTITFKFYPAADAALGAVIQRNSTTNGPFYVVNYGTGAIIFQVNGVETMRLLNGGGVTGIWDDTPTNAETSKGVTSDWAFDHVNDIDAHHAVPDVWDDEGDVAAVDYAVGNFTKDATWRDLDISGIVGAQKCLVALRVVCSSGTPGEVFAVRTNGDTNGINIDQIYAQVANVVNAATLWVETDASGVIEYYASTLAAGWTTLNMTVAGALEAVT
jgi:hypothetical protein